MKKTMISLVGGGGKTTTMFYIGKYFANSGERVIITTSTHIIKPDNYLEINAAKELREFEFGTEPLVIGVDEGKKLSSIDLKELNRVRLYSDIVLVEADGAKGFPIKLPREGEPVIPRNTNICIICMGIDAVGKSLKECCFRYERAEELFDWDEEHILTCRDAAFILTDSRVGRKGLLHDVKILFVINKVDTKEDMKKALEVEKFIKILCKAKSVSDYKVSITSYKNNREFCDFDFLVE